MTPNTRLGRLERKMGMDADNAAGRAGFATTKASAVPSPIVVASVASRIRWPIAAPNAATRCQRLSWFDRRTHDEPGSTHQADGSESSGAALPVQQQLASGLPCMVMTRSRCRPNPAPCADASGFGCRMARYSTPTRSFALKAVRFPDRGPKCPDNDGLRCRWWAMVRL